MPSGVATVSNSGWVLVGDIDTNNVPIYGTLAYFLYPQGYVTLILGYNADGKLSLYDSDGESVEETGYDPSVSMGFVASFRF